MQERKAVIKHSGIQLFLIAFAIIVTAAAASIWYCLRLNGGLISINNLISENAEQGDSLAILYGFQYTIDLIEKLLSTRLFWIRFELLFCLLCFFGIHLLFSPRKIYGFIYQHRWIIGFSIILFLTINKLHGDSIAMFDFAVQPGIESDLMRPVFGWARGIRSDEWVVQNPAVYSLRYLGEAFGQYNPILRGVPTVNELYMEAGNLWGIGDNVLDLCYLFLGIEYGFCFFWNARIILTVLVTFEFFRILSNGQNLLSCLGTALICLSSYYLWWIFPETLLFGHAAFVLLYYFFLTEKKWLRILCLILEPIVLSDYAMILYPAWQVPMAYILLALIVWFVHDHWSLIRKQSIKTWLAVLAAFCFAIILIAVELKAKKDLLIGQLSTVYPGSRIGVGHAGGRKPFYYYAMLLYPFKDIGNPCENSTLCSLFPLPVILAIGSVVKNRGKDWLLDVLLAVELFFVSYVYLGFPTALAKITLMSFSMGERTVDYLSVVCVYLLIVLLSREDKLVFRYKIIPALLVAGSVFAAAYYSIKGFPGYMSIAYNLSASLLLCAFGVILAFPETSKRLRNGIIIMIIVAHMLSGFCVRPIQYGFDAVDSKPLAQEITDIVRDNPDAKWVALGNDVILQSFMVACGAPTVNYVNTYPNMELWMKLDKQHQYENVYNRYAHVVIMLTEEETEFSLSQQDVMVISLSTEDFPLLETDYLISRQIISDAEDISAQLLYTEDGIYLYKVA